MGAAEARTAANGQTGASAGTLIEHARIVAPWGTIEDGWIWLSGGAIAAIGGASDPKPIAAANAELVDGAGGWVLPGFVDVHVHGGAGFDFMEANHEEIDAITRFHASHGTTGLLATSLTAPRDELTEVLERTSAYMSKPMPYAQILGVHFEGPFVNVKWKGAQNPEYILPPQAEWLEDWVSRYPGVIKLQTLAPETEGALDYIELLARHGIVPSAGHTDATYEQIVAAADRGLRHAVHTFNAMTPLHHRNPGTVGAVMSDDRIVAEVIADGHHVHPAAIKILTRAKGKDNVVLVTDAMSAAGMPDGDGYSLGGLPVVMKCGVARLKEGDSLAGSTLTMIAAFQNMVRRVGVSVEDASRMASGTPARELGLSGSIGSVEAGKRADVLLLDADLELRRVWIGGRPVEAASASSN
ncbi:N-acetylglucosamine-6-phosphate deacetylase [Cohnella nanjingensis]|uniref:N-acetylglucosamine-6-phosphate deacetylase n=1 Tax=Cohnella nanjingensis TaxID=1387779 RepID=A0A7X0RX77_9BACL|nr:N-acetylglucosamine-6-phosphate deacetylase [Cohnella nanjingensis]MBB6675332.1 N-acetylglucosamine-6-phosphate deacetylase [Cohnella nanjingensis]